MKTSFIKKILSFILSLTLCLSLGMVAFASGDSKVLEDDSALTPSVYQEQAAAQDAYSKLCASFKLTEDGSYVYPDDYAGAWYENGILHVVVTDNDAIAAYKVRLSEYDCVHYEIADYSLNELNYIRSSLYDALRDEYAAVSHHVDQKTNKINIGFLNIEKNRANINSTVFSLVIDDNVFKSVVSEKVASEDFKLEDMFVFYEGEIVDAEASIYGGMEINRGSSSGPGRSIGVSGTFTSNNVSYNGIITAGHNLETSGTNQILYRNGSEFGRVSLLMWKDNGNGDWACVRMTSSDTLTNKIYGSSSAYTRNITGTIDDLSQGMSLMKYGFSSGYAEATVNAQDQTITDSSGKTIKGLTKATLTSGTSAGGDSGGPYYTQGSAGGNNYNFLGVHWGSNTASGGSNIWFTPYVRFKSYFTVKTS